MSAPQRVILPSEDAIAELRRDGVDVHDPYEEQRRRKAYTAEVLRLVRLTTADVCGMTSRPNPDRTYRTTSEWVTGFPFPSVRRFGSFELAAECLLWTSWVIAGCPRDDRPPTRPFNVTLWPELGQQGPPPRKGQRRTRARRS